MVEKEVLCSTADFEVSLSNPSDNRKMTLRTRCIHGWVGGGCGVCVSVCPRHGRSNRALNVTKLGQQTLLLTNLKEIA